MKDRSWRLVAALVISLSTLVSCVAPPDVEVCTHEVSPDYFLMFKKFIDLCSKDEDCKGDEAMWKKKYAEWAPALESGYCTYTIQDKEREVRGVEWRKLSGESLMIPSKSWAKIKAYILEMCKKHNDCAADLGKWQRKMDDIDSQLTKQTMLKGLP